MRTTLTRCATAAGTVAVALMGLAPAASAAPVLLHSYHFNSGDFTDTAGSGTTVTGGGTFTTELGQDGYRANSSRGPTDDQEGLRIEDALAQNFMYYLTGNYTIEAQFSMDNVELGENDEDYGTSDWTGWQKLVDFNNLGGDGGVYYNAGFGLNYFNDAFSVFEADDPLGLSTLDEPASPETLVTLRITRGNTGVFAAYLNNTLIGMTTDTAGDFVFNGDIINLFNDDPTAGNDSFRGFVNYVDIYAHSDLDQVPEPASMLLFGTGLLEVARRVRKRQRKA